MSCSGFGLRGGQTCGQVFKASGKWHDVVRRDIAPHAEPRPEFHAETRPESRYADPANTTTHNEGFVGKLSSMMQRITNETEEDIITAQRLALVKQAVELVRLALSENAPSPP